MEYEEKIYGKVEDLDASIIEPSFEDFLNYEIRGTWWPRWIGFSWGQKIAGKYFAFMVRRKYVRYKKSMEWKHRMKQSSRLNH